MQKPGRVGQQPPPLPAATAPVSWRVWARSRTRSTGGRRATAPPPPPWRRGAAGRAAARTGQFCSVFLFTTTASMMLLLARDTVIISQHEVVHRGHTHLHSHAHSAPIMVSAVGNSPINIITSYQLGYDMNETTSDRLLRNNK